MTLKDSMVSGGKPGGTMPRSSPSAHLIRVPEAARLTGLPQSLLRKCFMTEEKRPKNVPHPPPHKRIGRAIYIVADRLPAWIESLNNSIFRNGYDGSGRRGRPTVTERIARRQVP
ncbi:MAG: hypothetical protein L0219_11550 [Phycisphaerales bacterium]|nr:hypothetical protein [Phycisphaerales bacterium]